MIFIVSNWLVWAAVDNATDELGKESAKSTCYITVVFGDGLPDSFHFATCSILCLFKYTWGRTDAVSNQNQLITMHHPYHRGCAIYNDVLSEGRLWFPVRNRFSTFILEYSAMFPTLKICPIWPLHFIPGSSGAALNYPRKITRASLYLQKATYLAFTTQHENAQQTQP